MRVLSNIKFNTDTLRFVYTELLEIAVKKKKRLYLRSVDVKDLLHEQETLLLLATTFS